MKSLTQYTTNRKNLGKKTLVIYITAGLFGWIDSIKVCIDNGADVIEVGLPFSDPIMDGPVIAKASAQALKNGAKTLELLSELSSVSFEVPIAVMTYANVLYSHGIENITKNLVEAKVSGLIVPDITFEQSALFKDVLKMTDIAFIPLISSTTSESRSKDIAKNAQGFLYCVAIKGVTGQDQAIDIDFLSELDEITDLPKYCGVGIRNKNDAQQVINSCDGIIVGTAIVEKILEQENSSREIGKLVAELRSTIDQVG